MRLTFFSNSEFISSNFSSLRFIFALNAPICGHIFATVILWPIDAQKKAVNGFERWKLVSVKEFFSNIWVVDIPRQWASWPLVSRIGFFPHSFLFNIKQEKLRIWTLVNESLEFCVHFCFCFRDGMLVSFFRPSGETFVCFWWLVVVPNGLETIENRELSRKNSEFCQRKPWTMLLFCFYFQFGLLMFLLLTICKNVFWFLCFLVVVNAR